MECQELENDDYEVTEEAKIYYTQKFSSFDRDGSGTLDKEELKDCLESEGFNFTPQGYKTIIKKFDVNRDGKLSISELVDNMNILAIHSVNGPEIEAAFKVLDKKKEGFVRLSTLYKVLTANDFMTPEEARKTLSELMAKYDQNQDGLFDYTEFVKMFMDQENLLMKSSK